MGAKKIETPDPARELRLALKEVEQTLDGLERPDSRTPRGYYFERARAALRDAADAAVEIEHAAEREIEEAEDRAEKAEDERRDLVDALDRLDEQLDSIRSTLTR